LDTWKQNDRTAVGILKHTLPICTKLHAQDITGRGVKIGIQYKKLVKICDSEIGAISNSGKFMAVSLVAKL
jgi:hypothetical protein